MKYKAKIKYTRDKYRLVRHTDFLERGIIDSDGYIYGYYVDGAIVGKFTDLNDEYTNLEYWCEVDISTLELVKESIFGEHITNTAPRGYLDNLFIDDYFI